MADTGNKVVTISQAARYLGITPQGPTSTGSKLITMRQLKSAVDGSAPSGGEKFVTLSQLKRVQTLEIVSWADGTDEEVAAMVAAADAGKLNLSDYWHEGDERTVHLSAMAAGVGLKDTYDAIDVTFVLTDPGHFELENGTPCHFVVLQKEVHYPKSSGTKMGDRADNNAWSECLRREWCNTVYMNALPEALRPIFKRFKNYSNAGHYNSSRVAECIDTFALFSEMEVFGSNTYSYPVEAEKCTQLEWFKTAANRKKVCLPYDYNNSWWLRSTANRFGEFCKVNNTGGKDHDPQEYNGALFAPFGCI